MSKSFQDYLNTAKGIYLPAWNGLELWVDPDGPGGDGLSHKNPVNTFAKALAKVKGDVQNVIHLMPRKHDVDHKWVGYDEAMTILRTTPNLILIGEGPRGAVGFAPTATDAVAGEVRADDVEIRNVGFDAQSASAAHALRVYGSRFRAYQCKIEDGVAAVIIGPGTVAQEAAETHGKGGDCLFDDCEFCWATNGLRLQSSDYGAVTQLKVQNCLFHNITTDILDENDVGAIGSVRDLWFCHNILGNSEDGTKPTNYVNLAAAGSTGLIAYNILACAAADIAAKSAYSTAVHWIANPTEGGESTSRP